MSIKALAGKRLNKKVKFMGEEVEIHKLSVSEVIEIQELAKNASQDDSRSFDVLRKVIGMAVEGGEEITDEEFATFPMDELSKLSAEIMKWSGLGGDEKGK